MGAHDAQAGDVAMLNAIGGVLLHLRKHVTHNLGGVVRGLWRARDLRDYVSNGFVQLPTLGVLGSPADVLEERRQFETTERRKCGLRAEKERTLGQ